MYVLMCEHTERIKLSCCCQTRRTRILGNSNRKHSIRQKKVSFGWREIRKAKYKIIQYLYIQFFIIIIMLKHLHSISSKKAVFEIQYLQKPFSQKISHIFSFLSISSLPLQTFSSYGGFHRITTRNINRRTKSPRYAVHIAFIPTDPKTPYQPTSAHPSLTSPSQPVNHQRSLPQ